nr:hypothetical protein [Allomuricauda sp.]
MESHHHLSDTIFEASFSDASLNPQLFTHEAHLRLAWIYIKKYGIDKAESKICDEIRQFDKIHGDGTKFNMTVTVAAVKMVHHFIKKSDSVTFSAFINQFPRLVTRFKVLLNQHYGMDVFNNDQARLKYLEPDLLSFD